MQKKSTKASQQQAIRAQILVSAVSITLINEPCEMLLSLIKCVNQEDTDADQMSSAVVQECSGSVCVRGAVHCRAYIHTNKPKTKHAAQVSTTVCVSFSVWFCFLSCSATLSLVPDQKVMWVLSFLHIPCIHWNKVL